MKFGKELATLKVPAWGFYYLDYDTLKKNISRKPLTTVEAQQREHEFAALLEKELQKINSFHSLKASELLHALKSIKRLIKQEAAAEHEDDKLDNWYEDTCTRLDEVTSEFIKFDEYKKINILAFAKLLKKHDKHQKNQIKGFWAVRLENEPFINTHTEIVDRVLIKLSKCWFTAKQLHNAEATQSKGVTPVKTAQGQVFERSTTKYWVPMDKVLRVKTEVLKHLPVSSFNKKSSSLITSVYYDTEDLGIYHERLRREEGAILVRMRTYNEAPHSTVFVERKVHHESWITEKSVKSRFPIKEKKLMKYLRGELSMKDKLDKMLANKDISEKEYESTLTLANEIQSAVVDRKLQPTMTTRYERSAFQLEGDATVRVSLDTRLDLITEHGYRNNKWGRDLTNEAAIPDNEIHHFPHAVLEIKLSFALGEEAPQWVKSLLAKEWIIQPGKFSKYIHGCAVLLPRKVTLLPPWFPILEATSDFRADDRILFKNRDGSVYKSQSNYGRGASGFPVITHKGSKVLIDVNQSPKNRTGKENPRDPVELVTMKNGKPEKDGKEISKKVHHTGIMASVPLIGRFFRDPKKPKKKHVQAPMKIEPKTFFANERTFLQWMSFLVLIVGFGITMLGLSTQRSVRICGLIFMCIAVAFMLYAIAIFLIRRQRIAERRRGPYDERLGPIMIVTLLIAAVVTMIVLYYGNFLLICKGIPLLEFDSFRYNPSDLAYNHETDQVVTVGPDMITYIDAGSHRTYNYPVIGDLEGVTYVPGRSGKIYIGNEYPAQIFEFDEQTHKVTRTINLDMPEIVKDTGLEALAFVPISGHQFGGQFWAGSQMDGKVYIFDVDFDNYNAPAVLVDSFSPLDGLNSLAALSYNPDDGYVWGIVGRRWIFAVDPASRAVQNAWAVGVGNPEGIVPVGSGPNYKVYIACDSCFEIWQFKFSWESGIKSGHCGGNPSDVLVSDDTVLVPGATTQYVPAPVSTSTGGTGATPAPSQTS